MTDLTDFPPPAAADPAAPLVPGFAKIPPAFWSDRVQRMRGEKGERPLSDVDEDGLDVRWLYSPDDALAADPAGLPGAAPFVRGTRIGTAWDIRQEHTHPVIRTANAQVLEDLVGGVTSVTLRLDAAGRQALIHPSATFDEARGLGGIAVSDVDDLDAVLEGAYLELAPVALDAGPAAIPAAALLRAVWERRELDLAEVRGSFGIDPIGTLAEEGHLLDDPADAIALAGRIAAETAESTPQVQSLRVDARAFVRAGATPALEIALAALTGTTYLRAAADAGLSPALAAGQIEFQLTAGQVQFQEIAKLRAFRRIWARILEASGVPADQRRSPVYARATDRMLSRVDPWTNLLRGTTSLFGAAVGGADGATVAAFDAMLGLPSTLGRRIARNTQIILLEESGLARVADPAGGSWYVESHTDAVAQAAWAHVQRLEGAGGITQALSTGQLQAELAGLAASRTEELVTRKRELTGVNAFPLLGDEGLEEAETIDLTELARRDRARRATRPDVAGLAAAQAAPTPSAATLASLTALATAGARIDELAPLIHGARYDRPSLHGTRDAEPFEALRNAATTAGTATPQVLLAPIGPLAATVTIVTWATNFFAVGGIAAVLPDGDEDPAALAAKDGHGVVVLCPGKGVDDDTTAELARRLRDAGADHLILAGATDERAAALGADRGVRDGIDMASALTDIQHLLTAKQDA